MAKALPVLHLVNRARDYMHGFHDTKKGIDPKLSNAFMYLGCRILSVASFFTNTASLLIAGVAKAVFFVPNKFEKCSDWYATSSKRFSASWNHEVTALQYLTPNVVLNLFSKKDDSKLV